MVSKMLLCITVPKIQYGTVIHPKYHNFSVYSQYCSKLQYCSTPAKIWNGWLAINPMWSHDVPWPPQKSAKMLPKPWQIRESHLSPYCPSRMQCAMVLFWWLQFFMAFVLNFFNDSFVRTITSVSPWIISKKWFL